LKWSAIGGGGGSSSDCYVGMPADLVRYACWAGRPVLASQSNKTIVGLYAGFNSSTGQHLITTSNDTSTSYEWGCYSTFAGATSTTNGAANTNAIIAANCPSFPNKAAQLCRNLGADWYLPARDELQILYNNRGAIGGFSTSTYWSSTEYHSSSAWYLDFSGGSQATMLKFGSYYPVRCVRGF
jgi:hypothetical protein